MKYCKFLYLKTVHWTVVLKISNTLHLVTYNDSFFFFLLWNAHKLLFRKEKKETYWDIVVPILFYSVFLYLRYLPPCFVAFTFCGCHVSLVVSFKVFSTSYSVLSLSILYASFVQSAGKHFGLTPAVLQNSYTNKSDFIWLHIFCFSSRSK